MLHNYVLYISGGHSVRVRVICPAGVLRVPLHVGHVGGLLVALHSTVGARSRRGENHLRRLPRGLHLAQDEHARGMYQYLSKQHIDIEE